MLDRKRLVMLLSTIVLIVSVVAISNTIEPVKTSEISEEIELTAVRSYDKNSIERVKIIEDPKEIELTELKLYDQDSLNRRMKEIEDLGSPVKLEGKMEVVIYDDFENHRSEIQTFIVKDGTRYRTYFDKQPRLISGDVLDIDGIKLGKEIVVDNYDVISRTVFAGEENPNLGEQKTVVLLVNSEDNTSNQPITTQEASDRVFDSSNVNSMTSWVEEVSYDKAFLSGDVFGWYSLGVSEAELCTEILNAIPLADDDVDYSLYNRLMIVFPPQSCGYGGQSTIGMVAVDTDDGTITMSELILNGVINIDGGIGNHELGHSFGAKHANDWECGNDIFEGGCNSLPREDQFDVMGIGGRKGHFNAYHKELIGWFNGANLLDTSDYGVYSIEEIETQGEGLKSVKVPLSDGFNYYIEYRRAIGYDLENFNFGSAILGTDVYNGSMIRFDNLSNSGDTHLIDFSPNSHVTSQLFDSLDVVLKPGSTFEDSNNQLQITTVSVTDEFLEVHLCWANEPCDDQNPNTENDTCSNGICSGIAIPGCSEDCSLLNDQCNEGVCDFESGECILDPTIKEGNSCDDSNLCTVNNICSNGICLQGDSVDCSGSNNQCNTGICDPGTGNCVQDSTPHEGQSCSDSNECTLTDMCVDGNCTGIKVNRLYGDLFPEVILNPEIYESVVDLDDILYVLAAFSSEDQCATHPTANIFPCDQVCENGVIDLDDILSVLSAFSGNYQCETSCQP